MPLNYDAGKRVRVADAHFNLNIFLVPASVTYHVEHECFKKYLGTYIMVPTVLLPTGSWYGTLYLPTVSYTRTLTTVLDDGMYLYCY